MEIYAITKSIGLLKQTQYNLQGFNGKAHKCYLTRQLLRSWFEYGKRYTYQYELFIDDESKPIEINGTLFDNKIEYYLDTGSALAYGNFHEITLTGKTPTGEVFETKYMWYNKYGGELHTATLIIYSLILTAFLGHERIRKLFLICFGQRKLEDENLGNLILMINEIRSIFKVVNKDYDFFGLFYQECIKHVIEVAQKKLSEFKIMI